MKKQPQQPLFLIRRSDIAPAEYLDAYNGGDEYEWTQNKARAWRLQPSKVPLRLDRIRKQFPRATVIAANRAAQTRPDILNR